MSDSSATTSQSSSIPATTQSSGTNTEARVPSSGASTSSSSSVIAATTTGGLSSSQIQLLAGQSMMMATNIPQTTQMQLETTMAASESSPSTVSSNSLSGIPRPASKRKRSSFDTKLLAVTKSLQPGASGDYKVGFIGCGNMARAIVEGMIKSQVYSLANITASATSKNSENFKKMKALGINVTTYNRDVIRFSDIIVIAVKPDQVLSIMDEVHDVYKVVQTTGAMAPRSLRPLIISVAAAVTLADIEQKAKIAWNIGGAPITGHLPIIRCLPNVGCAVRAGITVFTKGKFCNEGDTKPFLSVFSQVGHCEEVLEKYMDAFTAFSGSGVAFMAVALEAMADGGVMVGLPRATAQTMAAHTMLSAASIVLQRNEHPAVLKDCVASPAGTTIYGLHCLEKGGFRASIIDAIKKATDRAQEMRLPPT